MGAKLEVSLAGTLLGLQLFPEVPCKSHGGGARLVEMGEAKKSIILIYFPWGGGEGCLRPPPPPPWLLFEVSSSDAPNFCFAKFTGTGGPRLNVRKISVD